MPVQLRYPRYDLDSSIDVAQTLRDRGGGDASSNELASYLGYKSTNNGAFLARVAAARMFRLVEGHASRLRATDLSVDILRPDYPETEMRARLEAFESVPLFGAFLEEYEGQPLPGETGMRNALVSKFGVTPKKAALALARLLDSADQAGLFKVAGSRTKLIRPSRATLKKETLSTDIDEGLDNAREASSKHAGYPKLIEGALEAVPWTGSMTDEEIDEWTDFLRSAMKLHFRHR